MRVRSLRERLEEKRGRATRSKRILPADPVQFCREWLFFEPYEYMWPFLRDRSHFVALVQARQTGKTFNGMAKLLWLALRYPGSRILVTAPKYEQAKNIAFRALAEHLNRMKSHDPELFGMVCGGSRRILHTVIRLRNGSTLLAQPPVPETIRGHTARAVYLMEANFIAEDEELYPAVLFALNATGGYLIAESTPWNRDSIFYKMMHDSAYSGFSRYVVPYTEALAPRGPLNLEMVAAIEAQLRGDSARWRREMLCEWGEDADAWLPIGLIALAQDSAIDYLPPTAHPTGEFYVGLDFGKHSDPSVVSVVERSNGHLYLRHMHVFPLETSYGAVIGYTKRLQDNWRTIQSVYADKTGVGDYIVEDMQRGGIRNVRGVSFTDQSKEAMATVLKEQMRKVVCPKCNWLGYIDIQNGEWRAVCPCCSSGLRPIIHMPYDAELFHELNIERFELSKSGRLLFNHPAETHDDMFWALCLSVYAYEAEKPASRPAARTT